MSPMRLLTAVVLLALPSGASAACERDNFAVAIDTGHSPGKPGSTSARGKPEFEFNDRLARRTLAGLQAAGFGKAFLVNPDRRELSLHERTKIADRGQAALFISIHHDSVQAHYLSSWTFQGQQRRYSDQFTGFSLWISQSTWSAAGALTASRAIGRGLVQRGLKPTLHHAEPIAGENREVLDSALGIYRRDTLAVLRTSRAPAVLVEAGVIVNRADEALLELPGHQAKITAAIVSGAQALCESPQGSSRPQ
jgi:N-acetylmuramoyl-L-alanine amidase